MKEGSEDKSGWHILRRSFAFTLIDSGVSTVAVQPLLGHSDMSTTQPYLNVTDQYLDDSVSVLNLSRDNADVIPLKKP